MLSPRQIVTALLIAAALALTLLWPGDVSWGSDEPRLLAEAWHANHDGELARGGLWGNFGIRYGPLPTWIYQLLLLFTHDPIKLVAIRTLLCAGATAAGLLWLARELRLPSWFAAAILVAPFVVQYHRLLWDASFAIPLGAITLAAFAAFLRTGSRWTLATSVTGAILLPTIHPQGLPFTVATLGWLGWKQRPALRAHWKMLVAVLTIFLVSHGAWIIEATYGFVHNLSGSVAHGYPNGASHAVCALAPFLGGNLIGSPWITRWISPSTLPVGWILVVIYPLAWFGIARAVRPWRNPATPREIVGVVAVAGLVLQAALFSVMRIPSEPQYFFGTFALHAFLIWLAVDELRFLRLGAILGAIFGVSAAGISFFVAFCNSIDGYYPDLGWITLGRQVEVARRLNSFTDTTAYTTAPLYQKYPQALRALRLLIPPPSGQPQHANGKLLIAPFRFTSEVTLELDSDTSDAQPLDITPLPKGWHPDTW
jgi:hypothetical protein